MTRGVKSIKNQHQVLGAKSVSYTHLDVYKRQVYNSYYVVLLPFATRSG